MIKTQHVRSSSTLLVVAWVVGYLHDPQHAILHRLADEVKACDGGVLSAEPLQEQLHVAVVVVAEVLRLQGLWLWFWLFCAGVLLGWS